LPASFSSVPSQHQQPRRGSLGSGRGVAARESRITTMCHHVRV